MKIKGKKISGPNKEIIPIPRGDGNDIIFIAEAVLDQSHFDKLCPVPKPATKKIDGVDIPDLDDKNYLKNLNTWGEKKTAWMVLKALEATPDLEWEMVNMNDPSTWLLFRTEFRDAGLNDHEINRVINGALTAQGLNEQKVEEARDRFLRSEQARQEVLLSLKGEQLSMQSG